MLFGNVLAWLSLAVAALVLALVAAAEVSMAAISRQTVRRLLDEGVPRAQAVQTLLEDPARFVITLMVLKATAFVAAAGIATWLAVQSGLGWNFGIPAALLLVIIAMLCVQVVARAIASRSVETTGLRLGGLIRAAALILSPLTAALRSLGNLVFGNQHEDLSGDNVFLSEDGLRYLINVAEEPGLIEEDEKEMIASIFELSETVAREVLVPRIDVVALDEKTSFKDALDIILAAGHSRIPVYRDSIDNVQGVLYAKDLLLPFREGKYDAPITELMRPAYFVPESKKVDDLLRELQQRKVHMAIIVDEYGGTAGVVTIEDLLEEIVGEIQDEYDRELPMMVPLSENEYLFDPQIRLDEVNKLLDVELPSEESDTLGGFIYSELGSVPVVGSRVHFDPLVIDVLSLSGRRIQQVKVTRRPPRSEAEVQEAAPKKSSVSTTAPSSSAS